MRFEVVSNKTVILGSDRAPDDLVLPLSTGTLRSRMTFLLEYGRQSLETNQDDFGSLVVVVSKLLHPPRTCFYEIDDLRAEDNPTERDKVQDLIRAASASSALFLSVALLDGYPLGGDSAIVVVGADQHEHLFRAWRFHESERKVLRFEDKGPLASIAVNDHYWSWFTGLKFPYNGHFQDRHEFAEWFRDAYRAVREADRAD